MVYDGLHIDWRLINGLTMTGDLNATVLACLSYGSYGVGEWDGPDVRGLPASMPRDSSVFCVATEIPPKTEAPEKTLDHLSQTLIGLVYPLVI